MYVQRNRDFQAERSIRGREGKSDEGWLKISE